MPPSRLRATRQPCSARWLPCSAGPGVTVHAAPIATLFLTGGEPISSAGCVGGEAARVKRVPQAGEVNRDPCLCGHPPSRWTSSTSTTSQGSARPARLASTGRGRSSPMPTRPRRAPQVRGACYCWGMHIREIKKRVIYKCCPGPRQLHSANKRGCTAGSGIFFSSYTDGCRRDATA